MIAAYQVRRYGWSAKLDVSILTDFEEFAIYDCTKKPQPTDKASVARIEYFTFTDYLNRFDFIWDTFSKEYVLKGSFDKFVLVFRKGNQNKKGTTTVDKEFLQSLDTWRKYLANSISANNQQLSEDEINFVVQQTIDRIVFLRIAEDRSVEPYGTLKDTIKQGEFYKNLFRLFERADEKYNSGAVFSPAEISTMKNMLKTKSCKAGTELQASGNISKSILFLATGKAKSIYTSPDGKRYVWMLYYNDRDSCFENYFAVDFRSFLVQQPSHLAFEAVEDVKIIEISYEFWGSSVSKNENFKNIARVIVENAYNAAHVRAFSMLTKTAKERYLELLKDQPYLINKFHHYDIAAYLGVAPQSLSRLKNEIFLQKNKTYHSS
ncbi:hypothetical protein CHS0354_000646 [Potamilus streckersoni]|uniref:Uncharacterized protein n=1 Tax=Potamilus streckersoni TaxID=2493646 RepID=A0AAE0W843_9BIVA|nr:hypothetical protein CHS0354_000646 [Potamilus streckersoni]